MAKEMMIIFVYDSQMLQKEEDDPATAILYFHPGWVSDQQRTALCGQIIGAWHFLSNSFHCPRIFALQSGKFAIRIYGRYILAVGTDRNIADWVLDHRADTLTSLITFFHHDLEKMSELYPESSKLSAKLYHMFETYLKILMYGGHMFYNIPTIQLPKSASHVFLEAIQLLQSCQQMNHVLGGTIFYHNKVVATQLSPDLTKRLVLTDPYRIKSPAEAFATDFPLPLGVQLLQVYIEREDYSNLYEDSSKCRSIPQYLNKIGAKKTSKPASTRDPILLSAMKRDQSLIFTTVPEEDADQHSPLNLEERIVNTKSPDRPKFLNLKNKTTDSKFDVQNEPQPIPSTPFRGQTSVCSTPMTDLNKVLHQNIMSICVNPEESDSAIQENLNNSSKNFTTLDRMHSLNMEVEELPESSKDHSKDVCDKLGNCVAYLPDKNLFDRKRSASMWDFREKLKSFNKRITMRYYNVALPNLNDELEVELEVLPKRLGYRTITDPCYPIFHSNGLSISSSLYHQYLQEPVEFLDLEVGQTNGSVANTEEWKSVESFDNLWSSPKKSAKKEAPKSPPKLETGSSSATTKEARKSLTLPLKSLTSEQSENIFSPSNRSRNCGGVQLTPLMSRLSLLAMEERSSGFCSRDTTPGEYKDARFTPSQPSYSFLTNRKSSVSEQSLDEETERKTGRLQESVLFICGQQDMFMAVLLEEDVRSSPEVVNMLWEKCTECLGKLDRQVRHCLETYPGGGAQTDSGESYSYLVMDPQWDNVRRGGPWGAVELGVLTHLHRDFISMSNLTEIILSSSLANIKPYLPCLAFLLTIAVNISWSSYFLEKRVTRGTQIYWGFQVVFAMPCVPYLFGVYHGTRELLVPFVITVGYSLIFTIVWLATILDMQNSEEAARDAFNMEGYGTGLLVGFFVAVVVIHIFAFNASWRTWRELQRSGFESESEEERYKSYAYRRFETTRV